MRQREGFAFLWLLAGEWAWNSRALCDGKPDDSSDYGIAVQCHSGNAIPIGQTASFDHVTGTITGNLTLDMTAKTLTGTVSVVAVNSTSVQTIFSKTFSVLMSFGSNQSFKFVLLIPVAPFALGAICTVNSSLDQATFFFARNPDVGNAGMVNIVDVGVIFRNYSAVLGASGYDPAAASMLTERSALSMRE